MTTATILDIAVILLLIPTIIYAVVLNRKLNALRRSREELAKVVNSFNEATMRAEAGIPKLKKATTEANHTLKDRVDKAQTLRDDLAFMIERAEELATRLENGVRAARSEGVAAPAAAPQPAATYAASPLAATLGNPALGAAGLAAARAVAEQGTAPPRTLAHSAMAQTAASFAETAAELRSALGAARAEAARVSGAPVPPPAGGFVRRRPAAEETATDERSEAERELLKALQSAR